MAKAAKKKTARRPNPAFMKPMTPSRDLAPVIGDKPMPRTEVTKKLWAYIKKNGLQDPRNKRNINADEKLKPVFGGKKTVSSSAKGLQFFIVKGGAEGFLEAHYAGKDASRVVVGGAVTTDGKPGTTMIFDDNDLIAVFDKKGTLVSSALLRRPARLATTVGTPPTSP